MMLRGAATATKPIPNCPNGVIIRHFGACNIQVESMAVCILGYFKQKTPDDSCAAKTTNGATMQETQGCTNQC